MFVQAAITTGYGDFGIANFDLQRPQRGEVLIEIKASGVCHTDYDSLNWKRQLILGHEGSGIIAEIGPGVSNSSLELQEGDHVLLNWAIPCGSCFQCRLGAENICENRGAVPDERFVYSKGKLNASFGLGTMATQAVVPMQAVVKIPKTIPFPVAAILGCGVMTGFGSVTNAAKVKPGSSVVIIGCGGVGLSVIQGARYRGATTIIAVDVNEARLKLAQAFGASDIVVAERSDKNLLLVAKQIKQMTDGRGADYAFECTAVPELGPSPLAMVRSGGTAVGVSGIEQTVPVDMELFEWDKIYINPLYGQCRPTRDFPLLLNLYEKKSLLLDEMVTRTYSLNRLAEAFDDMHRGINAKGVILF